MHNIVLKSSGLGFKQQQNNVVLFVVTSNSVTSYFTSSKEMYKVRLLYCIPDLQQEVLDESNGCGVGGAVMSDEGDMIIGRKEVNFPKQNLTEQAVYFYEAEGRGPCFAFEGDKKLLSWFRSYLIVVGQDPNNLKFNTFNIYDLKNKLIAYSENRFQNITHVVSEWGSIFVLTGDGKVIIHVVVLIDALDISIRRKGHSNQVGNSV